MISLAFQGVRRKKKSSILIFMVLLLSFSFAIASLSLVGSMSKTNAEFRLNTYGEWYVAIPSGMEEDAKWLENQSWAEEIGISKVVGTVLSPASQTGLGTIDETLKKIGRLRMDDGNWPTKDNEIAMERDTLGALGYDYSLGQEIILQVAVPCGKTSIMVECKYTLSGIIHEYTDLWMLTENVNNQRLNGAVVTEEAVNQILEAAQLQMPSESGDVQSLITSIPQYFITVAEKNWKTAISHLRGMLSERPNGAGDHFPCENRAAYTSITAKAYDEFYIYIIAIVTLLAVICIYIMQLPTETHSFAVLRSIGITRGQMARLLLTESLMLCLPAVLFGIPCGMGVTWLALRFAMYSGSVQVQVVVPFTTLMPVLLLWVMMVLVSRLIVFFVTVRTSLTGRLQMDRGKSRHVRKIRSGFIVFLLGIFGAVTIFTSLEVVMPKGKMNQWLSYAPYRLRAIDEENNFTCFKQSQMELIEQVSGVREVIGYGVSREISLLYDDKEIKSKEIRTANGGMLELPIELYILDETQWEETFDFGEDRMAFHNGELVLMCFPDDRDEEYCLPQGEIQIRVHEGILINWEGDDAEEPFIEPPVLIVSEPTKVSVRWIPGNAPKRNLTVMDPYAVICSNAYLEKLLANLKPGSIWNNYTVGDELGYPNAFVYINMLNADDLSTDYVMAELCQRNNFFFENRRQEFMSNAQNYLQMLILLYASGGCIILMVLMICYSALSMEAEQEKQYFRTMRIIGMSSVQMVMQILKKALYRSFTAVFCGWVYYIGYLAARQMMAGEEMWKSVSTTVPDILSTLKYYENSGIRYLIYLSIICLLVPLLLSLIAKRKLRKESWIS